MLCGIIFFVCAGWGLHPVGQMKGFKEPYSLMEDQGESKGRGCRPDDHVRLEKENMLSAKTCFLLQQMINSTLKGTLYIVSIYQKPINIDRYTSES